MNMLRWLTGRFSNREKALSLYRRGMERSKKREHEGAIDDYTAAIAISGIPADVKAMALYNRALVYAAAGDDSKAAADIDTILEMNEAPPNIKAEARRKLVRMQRGSDQNGK